MLLIWYNPNSSLLSLSPSVCARQPAIQQVFPARTHRHHTGTHHRHTLPHRPVQVCRSLFKSIRIRYQLRSILFRERERERERIYFTLSSATTTAIVTSSPPPALSRSSPALIYIISCLIWENKQLNRVFHSSPAFTSCAERPERRSSALHQRSASGLSSSCLAHQVIFIQLPFSDHPLIITTEPAEHPNIFAVFTCFLTYKSRLLADQKAYPIAISIRNPFGRPHGCQTLGTARTTAFTGYTAICLAVCPAARPLPHI